VKEKLTIKSLQKDKDLKIVIAKKIVRVIYLNRYNHISSAMRASKRHIRRKGQGRGARTKYVSLRNRIAYFARAIHCVRGMRYIIALLHRTKLLRFI